MYWISNASGSSRADTQERKGILTSTGVIVGVSGAGQIDRLRAGDVIVPRNPNPVQYSWFCKKCWRRGIVVLNTASMKSAIGLSVNQHGKEVEADMMASKTPAGLQDVSRTDVMDYYPSVDCEGAIAVSMDVKKK